MILAVEVFRLALVADPIELIACRADGGYDSMCSRFNLTVEARTKPATLNFIHAQKHSRRNNSHHTGLRNSLDCHSGNC